MIPFSFFNKSDMYVHKVSGTDGNLVVSSNTSIPAGVLKQYNSLTVNAGSTLTITGTGVTEIGVRGDLVLNGTIIFQEDFIAQSLSVPSYFTGSNLNFPLFQSAGGNGGNGGRNGGRASGNATNTAHGNGGAGGSGNGTTFNTAIGNGTAPTTTAGGRGGNGGAGSGGAGGITTSTNGKNGANGSGPGSGAGGGGGYRGKHGGRLHLFVEGSFSGSGVLNVSGTSGGRGGNGGAGSGGGSNDSGGGGGGGGGAGGNGGQLYLGVRLNNSFSGTINYSVGSGGLKGVKGSGGIATILATDGNMGSAGFLVSEVIS